VQAAKGGAFERPGCAAHRPRNHTSHTFGPDCRYSLSTPRTGTRKRPYSRVPAEEEPTSGLRGSDLGVEDETSVKRKLVGHLRVRFEEESGASARDARRGPRIRATKNHPKQTILTVKVKQT